MRKRSRQEKDIRTSNRSLFDALPSVDDGVLAGALRLREDSIVVDRSGQKLIQTRKASNKSRAQKIEIRYENRIELLSRNIVPSHPFLRARSEFR